MKRKASRFLLCRVTLALLTLVMAFAGAQTADAATVTTNITYDGVAASDVTVSVTYTVQSTGFPPTEETKHETLSNGSRFYPVDNTVVTIAVTSTASITTEFSATYVVFGQNQTLAVNTSGNNCTFTPDPDYETTLNITVRQGGGGQQTGGVTPVSLTNGAVNMPVTGTSTLTIPNGVTTFKVYDDGGPSGNYSAGCDGYLLLTAPTGYYLQVTGTADTNTIIAGNSYLTIFDGGTTDDATVLNRFYSKNGVSGSSDTNDIGTVNSTGHQMLIYFHTYSGDQVWGTLPDKGLDLTVTVKVMSDHFTQSGDTYTILSATGWNFFCDMLEANAKGYFTGKTVMLYRDIEVNRMAGTSGHEFTGTFEGNKKTLTVSYGSADSPITEQYAAPFRYVDGGSFENLRVCGTIYTAAKNAGGLIADQNGVVTISNCRSSVTIQSSVSGDGTHGGFVAVNHSGSSHSLTIEGCVFDGKLLTTNGTTCCGGFIGWRGCGTNIYNSLFAPAEVTVLNEGSATFARNDVDTHNCYYTTLLNDGRSYVPGYNEQNAVWRNGKAPRSVTGSEYVSVEAVSPVGDATDTYNVSGITAYAKGIERGGTFYYGQGDDVSLTLSHGERSGYLFSGYSPSAGTLSGTTLTMPDDNVTINAVFTDNRYFVHFDKNAADATGTMADQTIDRGSTANLTSNAFTRDGYYFKSWNTEADGSGTAYANGASVTNLAALGQTVTLYAQWSDNWFSSSICVPDNGSIRAIIPDDASSFKIYDPAGNAHSYEAVEISTGYLLLIAPDECVVQLTGSIRSMGCELTVYDGSSADDTQIGHFRGIVSTEPVSLSDDVISTRNMMLIKVYFPGGSGYTDFDLTATVGHRVDVAAGLEHGTVSVGRTVFHEGTTVTLTPQPDEGYSVATVSVDGTPIEPVAGAYSFTMPGENVTVSATFTESEFVPGDDGVNYIDADGTLQTATGITIIESSNTGLTLGSSSKPAWYVVPAGTVTISGKLRLNDSDVRLILCDGATLTVIGDGDALMIPNGSLTIYGQAQQSGTINATNTSSDGNAIYSPYNITINGGTVSATASGETIRSLYGNIIINRGNVTANSSNHDGISAERSGTSTTGGDVTINGGTVTATGSIYGICAYNFTINGGAVSTTGGSYGIRANTITLGWTSASDRITSSSYNLNPVVKSGQTLYDEDGTAYSGNNVSIPNGKTLRPLANVLVLNDAADNATAISGSNGQRNVILQGRKLYKDGAWNTLCLPFDVTIAGSVLDGDGVDVRTLSTSGFSGGTLTLTFTGAGAVTTMEAGKPYIIKWTKPNGYDDTPGNFDITDPVFSGVTVSSTAAATETAGSEWVDFCGTYSPRVIYESNEKHNLYLGSGNTLYYPTAEGFEVKSCRGWFKLKGGLTCGEPGASGDGGGGGLTSVRAFNLSFGGEETGISEAAPLNDKGQMINDNWYTLDGRKLDGKPTKNGLYIHGGRKVVIK